MENKEKQHKIGTLWRSMAVAVQSKDLCTIRRTMHALHASGVDWSKKPLPEIPLNFGAVGAGISHHVVELPLEYDPLIDDTTEESTIVI